MPLKRTGKKIERIKFGKKKVAIIFDDGKIDISPNTYTEFNLFPGKLLSPTDLKKIEERDSLDKHYTFILNSLQKRAQTEKAVREKLLKREATPKQIEFIIAELRKYSLLDDRVIVEEYLEYAEYRHYGYNRLITELQNKGVSKETIDSVLKYDEDKEIKKARALLPILEKKYDAYGYEDKKHRIYDSLIRYGFEFSVAKSAIEKLAPKDEKKELKALQKDYDKALKKYRTHYLGKELKAKVINYLLSKGYRFNDIEKIKGDF